MWKTHFQMQRHKQQCHMNVKYIYRGGCTPYLRPYWRSWMRKAFKSLDFINFDSEYEDVGGGARGGGGDDKVESR